MPKTALSIGVIKNPPPTPNIPERTPTINPRQIKPRKIMIPSLSPGKNVVKIAIY
jgi:hypothetical protein